MKFILLLAAAAGAAASSALVGGVSSPLNDYGLGFDDARRTMAFARSEADFRHAHIFVAARRGRGWSEAAPIGFSDPRWSDSDPWLTPDGRTLYFISTRPAPGRAPDRTDLDVWRSRRIASGWSAPEHLGAGVNSPAQELGPELHGGSLYFSSSRPGGRGGLDVYAAPAAADGAFAPAVPVEGPFNGPESDSDFTLSRDGRTAMFWRSGAGREGAIYLSRRTAAGWSAPQVLPPSINHGPFNFTPTFSRDGRSLYYASTRARTGQAEGLADVYQARLPR